MHEDGFLKFFERRRETSDRQKRLGISVFIRVTKTLKLFYGMREKRFADRHHHHHHKEDKHAS